MGIKIDMNEVMEKFPFSQGHYVAFHEDEHEWALQGCPVCISKLLESRKKHLDWKDCCPQCLIDTGFVVKVEHEEKLMGGKSLEAQMLERRIAKRTCEICGEKVTGLTYWRNPDLQIGDNCIDAFRGWLAPSDRHTGLEEALMPLFIRACKARAKWPWLFGDFWKWRNALAEEYRTPRERHDKGLIWK